ncbi:MAG: SusC/RagA family TonB-linked outer membrane protein [Tannerellaceae bacterium]|nr:SusC/RagA family TonB-linked outer membrane protein [Tannerellaceae bacterium]
MFTNLKPVSLWLVAGLMCFSGNAYADLMPVKHDAKISQQQGKITGTVEDDFGPVTGASVVVKGTTNGTITDFDGNFELDGVKSGDVISISFIGYVPQEITYTGQGSVMVKLVEDTQTLDEVVVTALGIKREKKALGYATQELKGDALVSARESNVTNALSGKVSGLQVVRGSGVGSSSKIVLRGYSSLTGSNQPLVVIDGVPMDNFVSGVKDPYGNNGVDMGNGLADINPEDIESMSVLKGASAAALYGSRAGNGVILITTKSGRKQTGLGITVNAGVTTESIFLKPHCQHAFGPGENGVYDFRSSESWGAAADGGSREDWKGNNFSYRAYDNVDNFFNTGTSFNEGITFQQNYDGTGVFASINRSDDKGIVPEAQQNKASINLRGTTEFGENKRWKLDAKVNYINTQMKNRPLQGINQGNMFNTIYSLPRTLDITRFEDCLDSEGKMIWWDAKDNPQENPYWVQKYRQNEDTRNRILVSGALSYQITEWWSAELRAGTDTYTTNITNRLYAGGNTRPAGNYSEQTDTFYENNYSFLTSLRKDNLISKLGGSFTFGGNLMMQRRKKTKAETGDLLIPNLFILNNAKNKNSVSFDQEDIQRKMNSLYGTVQVNWDGWLFLDVTGRNDWSSTMSKENRSYFYPSFSLAGVISDMVEKNGSAMPEWFTFAKVRGSYAMVGNDLDPYQLYTLYKTEMDASGNPTASIGETLFDSTVRSELIKSWEAGVELKFLDNRLGVDVSWYRTNATRQLLEIPMDPFSGYKYRKINAGNIQNQGVEIMLYATILSNPKGFNWQTTLNASTNKNKIIELADGINEYGLETFDNLRIIAPVGGYMGDIYGKKFQRVEEGPDAGKIIVDDEGLPLVTDDTYYLGNQQPDWMLGWTNSFSYKNISLSFLIDARFGGSIYSSTTARLHALGNAAGTVVNGAREEFVVPNSVQETDGGGFEANDKAVRPELYWKRVGGGNIGVGEAFIYDASNIRLRNITLGYDLEKKWLQNTPLQRVFLSFTANNVWMIHYNLPGIDPEAVSATNTNAVGFENLAAPTSRSFTFNVSATF